VLNTYKNCCVDHLKKKRGGGIDEEEFEMNVLDCRRGRI